ncbi:hypothetical protein HDU96_006009, partial [Phlyctochytrium bullatum]
AALVARHEATVADLASQLEQARERAAAQDEAVRVLQVRVRELGTRAEEERAKGERWRRGVRAAEERAGEAIRRAEEATRREMEAVKERKQLRGCPPSSPLILRFTFFLLLETPSERDLDRFQMERERLERERKAEAERQHNLASRKLVDHLHPGIAKPVLPTHLIRDADVLQAEIDRVTSRSAARLMPSRHAPPAASILHHHDPPTHDRDSPTPSASAPSTPSSATSSRRDRRTHRSRRSGRRGADSDGGDGGMDLKTEASGLSVDDRIMLAEVELGLDREVGGRGVTVVP